MRHAKRSTARDFKIVEPNNMVREENGTNHDADCNDPNGGGNANESSDESENKEENGSEKILSPEPATKLASAVEDSGSESDDENRDGVPSAKRVKRNNMVQDSDDEA